MVEVLDFICCFVAILFQQQRFQQIQFALIPVQIEMMRRVHGWRHISAPLLEAQQFIDFQ